MHVCNYQKILQPFIITSFLTQKHLNYNLKGTTSEKSAELHGEGNERQLCVGDWLAWFPGPVMLRVTMARWTTIDSGQNRTESLVHTS